MMFPPYIVDKSSINDIGKRVGVPGDGNCLYHSFWANKCCIDRRHLSINIHSLMHSLYMYVSRNVHNILSRILDKNSNSVYGNYTRITFSISDISGTKIGVIEASKRVALYWRFYCGKIMSAIWNPYIDFKLGAAQI